MNNEFHKYDMHLYRESFYYYEDRVITPATHMYRVYHADEVDAAIAELKARIQLDDDEMAGFLQLEEECGGGDLRNYIAELKQKLSEKDAEIESLKASHYADSVDAGMRERRLRRALWMARAERAKEKQQLFLFSHGYEKLCIDGFYDPYSGRRELSPKQWVKAFNKVEIKCLNKAEEYR